MQPIPAPSTGPEDIQRDVPEDCVELFKEEEAKNKPTSTLCIPTPESMIPSDAQPNSHSSLLSSLGDELIQSALECSSAIVVPSLPSSSEYERQQQLQRQEEDDEFAAITLQRMRSLRQRILDSIPHPPSPLVEDGSLTAEAGAVEPSHEGPEEENTKSIGLDLPTSTDDGTVIRDPQTSASPDTQSSLEITSFPSSFSPTEASLFPEAAKVPATTDAPATPDEDDDEPRERSCTVDSDDEIDE